jgi:NADH-quinone oxidoreductase subunit M
LAAWYDRTHTRDLAELHELNLSRAIPFAAVIFTLAGMASMGLPGFSGFIAELQVLIGAWQASPTIAVIAGVGIVVGVAYTLRALQQAFFPDQETLQQIPAGHAPTPIEPISVPERIGAMILIGSSLVIGLFPSLLLDRIVASFSSPLFDGLRQIGGLSS